MEDISNDLIFTTVDSNNKPSMNNSHMDIHLNYEQYKNMSPEVEDIIDEQSYTDDINNDINLSEPDITLSEDGDYMNLILTDVHQINEDEFAALESDECSDDDSEYDLEVTEEELNDKYVSLPRYFTSEERDEIIDLCINKNKKHNDVAKKFGVNLKKIRFLLQLYRKENFIHNIEYETRWGTKKKTIC